MSEGLNSAFSDRNAGESLKYEEHVRIKETCILLFWMLLNSLASFVWMLLGTPVGIKSGVKRSH